MKHVLLLVCSLVLLSSCSSVKRSKKALHSGNYTEAITIAVGKLQKDKTKKGNREHIAILEEAFKKVTQRDQKRIAFLEKEGHPANSKEIYRLYTNLDGIQERIYPLLPLYHASGKEAKFRFTDYSDAILQAKENYAAHLYHTAEQLLQRNTKMDYREAYHTLKHLQTLVPNYRNSSELLQDAHFYGTDFIYVRLTNQSNLVMPRQLERELLNFNTYGLDDFWTVYHNRRQPNTTYHYNIDLAFRSITASPERLTEQQIPLEREIRDGYTYEKDRYGNFVRDSLGEKIKIERYITVKGTLYTTRQSKALTVEGMVKYLEESSKRTLTTYPLATEFVFENQFATFEGDQRVLHKEEKQLLRNRFVPFPSNEQMLLDASDDLKGRLGAILANHRF